MNRICATLRNDPKWLYRLWIVVLLFVCLPSNLVVGQQYGDSQYQIVEPPSTEFWEKLTDQVKTRRAQDRANQPTQAEAVQELQVERACYAAQQELQRRGLINEQGQPVEVGQMPSQSNSVGWNPSNHYTNMQTPGHHNQVIPNDSVAPHANADPATHVEYSEVERFAIDNAHANCFDGTEFPSAAKCQACHPEHYREWSVSPHAYAQMSPVFNAMSSKLIQLTNGTLGDFCIRCHTPVGMALDQPIAISNMDRTPSEREGVTCVVCHRINQNWGKISGRHALVGGGLDKPVYGPIGNDILQQVLADPDQYGVLTSGPKDPTIRSREVHSESIPFFALGTSAVCGSCHDVFAPNGFRLEDAFSEYKTSPAARIKQQSCQDCHMGVTPGVADGYRCAPAAIVGNASTPPRKRTNHMMIGPDYSIIHPGLFPHNPKAVREEYSMPDDPKQGLATMREWLQFDYKKNWGTEEFERNLKAGYAFPEAWNDRIKRIKAREILEDQFELLNEASVARHHILSVGYGLGDVVFKGADASGLYFDVNVYNGTDGHGVPTGFDAERLVFLRVTVYDSCGNLVFVSGDLDPNGDVRDSHSVYVHNGKLPVDRQLFSLQTRFLTRNIRGGEREQVLNIPYSLDPLPYIRPATRPYTVLGRPIGARKHKQNIEVGGHRWAKYHIQRSQLTGNGPYVADIQLVAGMVPVNLIHAIQSAGFDYGMSAKEIAKAIVDGHVIVHHRQVELNAD